MVMPSMRTASPAGSDPSREFKGALVRQNPSCPGIRKHGVQPKVPFSYPGVGDVMVSHS